jgi:hypothetical protein
MRLNSTSRIRLIEHLVGAGVLLDRWKRFRLHSFGTQSKLKGERIASRSTFQQLSM